MTFHDHRGPRPAAAPPAARQPGPVTMALRAMQTGIPETERERVRALRRSIADRIEADIALLDMLSGDADLEDGADAEPSLGSQESSYHVGTLWSVNDGKDLEEENEPGGDINDEPHDPEEDMGSEEEGDYPRLVQFNGYNYHSLRAR